MPPESNPSPRPPFRQTPASGDEQSLIAELENAIASREVGSRAALLRRITDLFMAAPCQYDGEQLAVFDDVMGRLVEQIEHSARVAFGRTMATIAGAPPLVSRRLALDDSIEIAGPLLTHSERLDDETLIASAQGKSQVHLLAISRRAELSEVVTDVLVEHGNQEVIVSTATNLGARFSEFGYSTLVTRSEHDSETALAVWRRPEVPRQHLLALFAAASADVRAKLATADRTKAILIDRMIVQAADKVQTQARDRSRDFAAVQARIEALHRSGELDEPQLCAFAQAGKFGETTVALSLLADLPIGAVERALVHERSDQLVILAKSIELSWATTCAILKLRTAQHAASDQTISKCHKNFDKLQLETARTAIRFYRLRERAVQPAAGVEAPQSPLRKP